MSISPTLLARAFVELAITLEPKQITDLADACVALLKKHGQSKAILRLPTAVKRMLRKYGPVPVDVTSATKLTTDQAQALEKAITTAIHRSVDMTVREDPSLIGGITLRIGDERFDDSLRGALNSFPAPLLS